MLHGKKRVLTAMAVVGSILLGVLAISATWNGQAESPPGGKDPTAGGFSFLVDIPDVLTAKFKNVEGLESETEVIEFNDDTDPIVRKRPGRTTYSNIVLKRGFVDLDDLWVWRKNIVEGIIETKDGSVTLLGNDGTEIVRYNFFEAWPCKWKVVVTDDEGSRTIIEEFELCIESIERIQSGSSIRQ